MLDTTSFKEKKSRLLQKLAGNKLDFKRLSLSPIRYAGGKSLAVGHIVKSLPPIKRLISPFFGGGSVEIAIAKELGIEVIACDINKPLVNYWHFQINYPKKLYNKLKSLKPTKEEYNKIREICKLHRKGKISLTKLEQAVYFFFNHNLSYGPSYIGWASSVYLDKNKYGKMIDKVKNFKADIKIANDSFETLFKKYPNDFFYCDPPYFLKQQDDTSKMFAGIYPERNNPVHHNNFNHELLRNLLKKHKGGFILSYNDCYKSRQYYKNYKLDFPSWQYTLGQGETRISKTLGNRNLNKYNSHIKKSHEILVIST